MKNKQDDLSFDDVSNYSFDVADKAEEFKTLSEIKIEQQQKQQQIE